MDHETALKLQAAERYAQGELPGQERDAFEEHFFSCEECAEEVRWEQMFSANAKAVFQDQETRKVSVELRDGSGRLEDRLKPQLSAAIPISAVKEAHVLVHPGTKLVSLLIAPPRQFQEYSYQLIQQGGETRLSASFESPQEPADKLVLSLPTTGLRPGRYRITFSGIDGERQTQIADCQLDIE